MGRPPKRNLNYSTWDVDVLENDTSIDNLIDAQGPAGFYVYFALCQKAYATDGYFYRWGYDNAASTARKLGGGLKSTQVRAIVDLCVSLGLFDKALFTTDGILTSRAIQVRQKFAYIISLSIQGSFKVDQYLQKFISHFTHHIFSV